MTEERLSFQAEVSRLLDIVAHSLYSEKEVFLRELISNASDACDRLRYAALTEPALSADDPNLAITLVADKDAGTLTVADNGIGMSRENLIADLGTIARSGSAAFLSQLSGDARKDVNLIGQFGVGFYSAFMVAEKVEVVTRRAGEHQGWRWVSDGRGEFTVSEAEGEVARGTQVILHLRADDKDYLEEHRLRAVVRKYSDHIALPIKFGRGEEAATLNTASALWARSKSEITPEQYKEFYHHVGHSFDEPWLTVHWRAEGKIEYTGLVFVPSSKPFDLFDPKRAHHVKLYVKRVFITDEAEGLVPPYLRFLRGVIDSEDLPLNVSREMLQNNPLLTRIKAGLVKRVLADLQRKADDPEAKAEYDQFWDNFGAVLKEGLYEDFEHREALLKLARFQSSEHDGLVSFDDYLGRLKEGQEDIYYITGEDRDALLRSPHLEGFKARGVEVLLLTDAVDEFWTTSLGTVRDKKLKSITQSGADLSKIKRAEDQPEPPPPPADETAALVALFKSALGEAVKDVRLSERLTDSAVCLSSDEGDVDLRLERLLRAHRQFQAPTPKRVLELNPNHPLVRRLAGLAGAAEHGVTLGEVAWLLLDQARVVEGEPLPDPVAFARRLASFVEKGFGAA